MKNSEILINALNLIDTPGKWTRGAYARDDEGNAVSPDYKHAHCFCSVGAVVHCDASHTITLNECVDSLHLVANQLGYRGAGGLNDAATDQFSDDMTVMWMTAIFTALADESK